MPSKGYDPVDVSGEKWSYPQTPRNLRAVLPWFYNQMSFIGEPAVQARIMAGIFKCVKLGEDKFQQGFGGYNPESNEFGLVPLRPQHVDINNSRWRWTSGATSTINWSAADNFVASFNAGSDELFLIFGYYNLEPTPNLNELFIQPGSEKYPIITVEPLRCRKECYFLLPMPFIVEPRSQLTIQAACKSISIAEEAGILGYFFAPKSKLIYKTRIVS